MFDESEILFLDTAKNLQFITASQRARLIAFAEDDDLGAVTEVVVDANLMTEEEVAETMQAIQAGVGVGAQAPDSVGREDISGAATSASIAALIGDDDEMTSADTDKINKSYESDSPFDALEAASQAGPSEEDDHYEVEGEGPAFPLPTGANSHPQGEDAAPDQEQEVYHEEEVDENQSIAQQLAVSRGEMTSLLESIED